ncbi:hypothetical protein B566_EDAN011979 [Ephemera danica]|nr:hypothetical protein B566_EDAN011979 [Ephemera danica]
MSSSDACSITNPGSAPFSEPESQAISNFLLATPSITFYCAVHTYGKYMLYPWAHTVESPPNIAELNRVGTDAANAIASIYGTTYLVGTFGEALYIATGTSQDWAHGVRNIALSYTIELPGGGVGGFNPPPSDIIPVVTETWEGIKVFAANIP